MSEIIEPRAEPELAANSESVSETGSGSDSSSDSSSDSDSQLHMARPIFLKKKQNTKSETSRDSPNAALAKAEHILKIAAKSVENLPFDGVDDRDDIDPEEEYRQWTLREAARKKRDSDRLAEEEKSKEDALRRKKGVVANAESDENVIHLREKAQKSAKIGSFYAKDVHEKFLKRDYTDVEGNEDHSRPTKYKSKR
ncbi:microfibrillar-associated protein 1 [Metschnikowia aff. pulcherrima]|uniref:Microfibrillar-associated protein 1 n=1 Tax=Metschnikowia aff. pulcherrima TaxID=2163413 RepID=A0A4V1ADL7_9ASCO|nr:microfibrillar-associated protein 1 [Metschnikowia aff. pulcherrima]